MVGVKGTGMTALAELLRAAGAAVRGSDVSERFYTDDILEQIEVGVTDFEVDSLPAHVDLLIHSAAYDPQTHPQIRALAARGLEPLVYTAALGALSRRLPSIGVAGVHGKTTSTALIGSVIRQAALPATVLAGSAVSNFGGRSTYSGGESFFVAETCEYRRHFLAFSPRIVMLTSVEADHLDYFRDAEDVHRAFMEYCRRISEHGALVYCADDAGASGVAAELSEERPDVRVVPYGFSAGHGYRISRSEQATDNGVQRFRVSGHVTGAPGMGAAGVSAAEVSAEAATDDFELRVPGAHNVLNATGALAVLETAHAYGLVSGVDTNQLRRAAREAFAGFRGTRRRAEIIGEAAGVLVMDDYAHHPTAIRSTLAGIKAFYPNRRLVVSFMSHTYSRTASLLDDFARSFGDADVLILHRIYASAREHYEGGVTGHTLYAHTRNHHPNVIYIEDIDEAYERLSSILKEGDLFLTMGAGDNFRIAHRWVQDHGHSGE